ncbi:hypothetical protein, partial [Lactococcus petauri]|uniref:hypothetical protein n=1 Tax=Lactococcus petauri TaxID=1940789 RepID=UPI00288DE625
FYGIFDHKKRPPKYRFEKSIFWGSLHFPVLFIAYMIGKREVNIIIPKEIMMKSAIATLIIEVNKILTIP